MIHAAEKYRSSWNFSLRELMLLVTAVAALLALAVKSYPSPRTRFYYEFDAQAELQKLLRESGIQTGSSSGGGGGSSSSWEGRKHWSFASHQTKIPLGEIGHQYAERVEVALKRAGCTLQGSSRSGSNRSLAAF